MSLFESALPNILSALESEKFSNHSSFNWSDKYCGKSSFSNGLMSGNLRVSSISYFVSLVISPWREPNFWGVFESNLSIQFFQSKASKFFPTHETLSGWERFQYLWNNCSNGYSKIVLWGLETPSKAFVCVNEFSESVVKHIEICFSIHFWIDGKSSPANMDSFFGTTFSISSECHWLLGWLSSYLGDQANIDIDIAGIKMLFRSHIRYSLHYKI